MYCLYTFYTVYAVYTIQTALHCMKNSMYVYIYILLGKVRTLLEKADGILSKMSDARWVLPLSRAAQVVPACQPGCEKIERE